MEEMLQLFAQPGVFDRQAEGVNNHQSDHSGHPHLDEVAGDGSDGDDEVAVDDGLGEVVPHNLDGAARRWGRRGAGCLPGR